MKVDDLAKSVFKKVREFYTRSGSAKSSNKNYDLKQTPNAKKNTAEFRNIFEPMAFSILNQQRNEIGGATHIAIGEVLYKQKVQAMNCGELAQLSCYIASTQTNMTEGIALATLSPPADHWWCIVGLPGGILRVKGRAIKEIDTIDFTGTFEPWFVDAWLNVCCPARRYPAEAAAKFAKWLGEGKRIRWSGEWHEPAGKYEAAFRDATVKVSHADR